MRAVQRAFEGVAEGKRLIKDDSNYDGWTILMILLNQKRPLSKITTLY